MHRLCVVYKYEYCMPCTYCMFGVCSVHDVQIVSYSTMVLLVALWNSMYNAPVGVAVGVAVGIAVGVAAGTV